MQNFELFVKSLQSAIVNSSESIRKRNENILDDYFYKEINEVILENKDYNKELFLLLQPIRNNDIFLDYVSSKNLDSENLFGLKQVSEENSNLDLTKEDDILALFLFEVYNFSKKNDLKKLYKEKNSKDLTGFKFYNNSLSESIKSENETKQVLLDEVKEKRIVLANLENELRVLNLDLTEHDTKKQILIDDITSLKTKQIDLKSNSAEHLKITDQFIKLNKSIDPLSKKVIDVQTKINSKDLDLVNLKSLIEQLEIKIQGLVNSINNNEQLLLLYFGSLLKLIEQAAGILKIIKSNKIDIDNIKDLIKNSKRYIKKKIEALVPKTVRVNYPSTFDFATPDNDKEYKTISTPVEVPLLTLVPINNYNIEKATFSANFKFDVIEDVVMIDFSKENLPAGEQSSNFGKLEIVLSPQQTPDGLKALIESYENFLKRQIV